jgi:8-oxo-dGTP diphosphatase
MAKERLNPSLRKAGVWAIIQCADTGKVLLGKRSSVVNNGGAWNFFGGRVDRGESPRTALLRELVEEAGLRVKEKQLVKLGQGRHRSGDRELHYYLLRLEREVAPRLNREHSNFGWFKPGRLPARFNRPTTIAIKKGLLGSLRQH